MELKTAIEILEYYQEWRLGKREDMIHDPKRLTEALDMVLSEVKRIHLGAVSGQSEQLPCGHEWLDHSFDHFGFLKEQICDKCGAKEKV